MLCIIANIGKQTVSYTKEWSIMIIPLRLDLNNLDIECINQVTAGMSVDKSIKLSDGVLTDCCEYLKQ